MSANVSKKLTGLYHTLLSRAVQALAKTGVHPNILTMVSLLPAILAGFAAADGSFYWAAILFLISGIFDVLDGELARQTGQATKFGALLDSTLDRISDAAIPLGLIVFYASFETLAIIPALAILSGITISYIRARAEGLKIALPRLWMRREDRLAITLVALVLSPIPVAGLDINGGLTLIILAILAFLSFVAAIQALLAAAKAS